jgi:chromosome segregation ATPase
MPAQRSPWLVALLNPLNLAMLAAAVGAGLVAAWWLFPVGLLGWALMVVGVALDPRLRLAQTFEARAVGGLAQRFQGYFDRLQRVQAAVYRALAEARGSKRRHLEPLRQELDDLMDRAFELCQRFTILENQRLVEQSNADTQKDLVKISELIAAANDPVAKREYEQSRQALQTRLSELEAVSVQIDRFEALLSSLRQELDRVQGEVVRLQTLPADQVRQRVPDLLKVIRQERTDMQAFEASLVAGPGQPASVH